MTHTEHAAKAKNSTPCTAELITFGGRCLACGYDPAKEEAKTTYQSPQGFTGKRMGSPSDGAGQSGSGRGGGLSGKGSI